MRERKRRHDDAHFPMGGRGKRATPPVTKLVQSQFPKSIYINNQDLGVQWQDAGPWRNFELTTSGRTEKQLLENATISEIDQDGGELSTYALEDASEEVKAATLRVIREALAKARAA